MADSSVTAGIPPVPVVDCEAYWRAGAREVRVFRGHHDPVWAVAYHPDGTIAASGSVDHTIRIWEVDTGRMLRILRGHSDTVRCLAFSPDGQMLASGSTDRTIRLWNPKTGEFIRMLFGRYDHAVHSLSFSPDGLMLARANENRDIKIWEVSTATELLSLLPRDVYDRHWNICTVFSPDGRLLASGNDVGGMTLFEVLPSGQELCAVDGHKSDPFDGTIEDRNSTRLNSSHTVISYAVFCLKKKKEVLRVIGSNRAWTKNYKVVMGLAKNPKTPVALSLNVMNS